MGKRRISMVLLSIVLVIVSIFSNFGTVEVNAADVNSKLKEKLVHIKTTEAGNGFEDLEPLKEILKNKKIIGLGESTLGSKEFYEIKHRLVEFLVEEMDYRVFAIDAEFADVKVVNDYINGDDISTNDAIWALRHFRWAPTREKDGSSQIISHSYLASWTTTEITAMLEWMRDFNENPANENKIKFYGIDIEIPVRSIDDLFEYLYIVDEEMARKYNNRLSDIKEVYDLNIEYPTARPLGLFAGMMEELHEEFKIKFGQYMSKSSENEYKIIEQDINNILQWIDYRDKNIMLGTSEALKAREYHMAKNVEWILKYEEQFANDKLIVWAHNSNIIKKANDHVSMGRYLQETFGDEYYAIGLDFYEGKFRAFGIDIWGNPISNYLAKFKINTSPKETLAYKLNETGIPISFLDFKSAGEDEDLKNLLSSEQSYHNIGLMYPGKYAPTKYLTDIIKRYSNATPMEAYDGFIFIKEVSETRGVHDARDTRIEDGDDAIISHYLHILFGQASTIISILIVSILIILFIRKKVRNKVSGKGGRYPTSDRWD